VGKVPDFAGILRGLSPEQEAACKAPENVLLTACPGSGKTRTLTRRLAYQAAQEPASKKWNIAITFTNRAADEIASRLDDMGVDLSNIWTSTIHQFCMHFIIRPYAMYLDRLSKGYSIIDEFTKRGYGENIAKKLQIKLNDYDDPFQIQAVVTAYETLLAVNKEIDFEMILRFSEKLLSCYSFVCENLAYVINSIMVDEFQDTTELQYSILAKIFRANKSINLMFVGDVNQAIYGSLGGTVKCKAELDALYETTFHEMSLTGCYRSTQQVVNFYKNFEISQTGVCSVADIKDAVGTINYDMSVSKDGLIAEIATIIRSELASGTQAEEICVLAPQWNILFDLSRNLRSQLPDVSFDAPDISPIKYDPMNPLFLLARLLFMPSGENVSLRKRIATGFISIIRDHLKIKVPEHIQNYDILFAVNHCRVMDANGIVCLRAAIDRIFDLLSVNISKEEAIFVLIERFFEKIDSRVRKHSLPTNYNSICRYFRNKQGVVISTIHGVKGEEYNTVIAACLLNGHLPNWNLMKPEKKHLRKVETSKLLYVLCSRAKQNLYLFSETGRKTKKGSEYTPTDELSSVLSKITRNRKRPSVFATV
jgi:superfamily I DNA/RNA helicase